MEFIERTDFATRNKMISFYNHKLLFSSFIKTNEQANENLQTFIRIP